LACEVNGATIAEKEFPTMPSRKSVERPNRRKPAPPEYAGQWVAWDRQQTEIVAHGSQSKYVLDAARAAGHAAPVMQKVPTLGSYFIGATRHFATFEGMLTLAPNLELPAC
jgi:hypothetical protein